MENDTILPPRAKRALEQAEVATALRERNRGRIETGHDRRPGLYSQIRRDEMLVYKGVMPAIQAHRDADVTRKPDMAGAGADFLRMAGENVPPTKAATIERALSNSDLPSLVLNTAQKSASLGYDQAEEMWPHLSQQGSVDDFRPFDVITSPEFPSPQELVENGEVPTLQLGSDSKESSALVSHTSLFAVTRQAMLSNDVDGFTTVPQALGRAASRSVGDKFFSVLISNGNMTDGNPFFSTAHNNVIATGSAPSITALNTARAAMAAQRGPSDSILNLRIALILGPVALEQALTNLRDESSSSADDSLTPGYVAGRFSVVTDARLDAVDASAWYCLANPKMHSGIGVYFISGGESPLIERVSIFKNSDLNFRLLHDFAVLGTESKTWLKNSGA